MTQSDAELLYEFFVNDSDAHLQMVERGSAKYLTIRHPISLQDVEAHLAKEKTLGTMAISKDGFAKFTCLDIDAKPGISTYQIADKIVGVCEKYGVQAVVEQSDGHGSLHVWVLWEDGVSAGDAREFGLMVIGELKGVEGVEGVEVFPKQKSLNTPKSFGNGVKLPLGKHLRTDSVSTLHPSLRDLRKNPLPEFPRPNKGENNRETGDVWDLDPDNLLTLPCIEKLLKEPGKLGTRHDIGLKNLVAAVLRSAPNAPKVRAEFYGRYGRLQVPDPDRPDRDWVQEALDWEPHLMAGGKKPMISRNELEKLGVCTSCGFCEPTTPVEGNKGDKGCNRLSLGEMALLGSHLPFFDDLVVALGIHGDDYLLPTKAHWYSLLGVIFRVSRIVLGDLETDSRFHLAVPIPSGHGKSNYEQTMKTVLKKCGYAVVSPTSYHPEQFVGKTIVQNGNAKNGGKAKARRNPGHLKDEYVVINEALDLLKSEKREDQVTKAYLRTAMDDMGKSEITKRQVDNLRGQTLRFRSKSTIVLYFQPERVVEDLVTKGTLRRLIIPYVPLVGLDKTEAYEKRLMGREGKDEAVKKIVSFLRGLKSKARGWQWTFPGEVVDAVRRYHGLLIGQGQAHSPKGRNYTEIMGFGLQNYLVKMACIRAAVRGSDAVLVRDVELAYMDLVEFWAATLDYVGEKVMGEFDYGESWGGATGKDRECLIYLYDVGAMNEDLSKVSIVDYENYITKLWGCTHHNAKKITRRQAERGWIEKQQIGQTKTRVWVKVGPNVNIVFKTPSLDALFSEYHRIAAQVSRRGSVTTLTPLTTLKGDAG